MHISGHVTFGVHAKKGDEEKITRFFIGNIPYSVQEKALTIFLTSILGKDTVTNVHIARSSDKHSQGYGFFEVSSDAVADRTVSLVNGKPLNQGEVTRNVTVSLAREV